METIAKREETVMKLFNFRRNGGVFLAAEDERGLVDVYATAQARGAAVPHTTDGLIAAGEEGLQALRELLQGECVPLGREGLEYAPVVLHPEKVLCVGLNYVSHIGEFREDLPAEPVLFSKFNNALAAHNEIIPLPRSAQRFDYEAELVLVMGKTARDVPEDQALSYVFGYTAGNDLSARDLQFRSAQWLLGKTPDKFAPTGPCIVTSDVLDPNCLDISCRLNGETRQHSNTDHMIFSPARIISYASRYMTLQPGDLIFTGTPGGVIVGKPEGERVWMKPGDTVEVEIGGIGVLSNTLA